VGPHVDDRRRRAIAAPVLKLTNNILSAVALPSTAEAFVMGAKKAGPTRR
jgi:3-hydroxyisobutyrate dehydrogenase-like beta-hydroxyacid dehydrogenase